MKGLIALLFLSSLCFAGDATVFGHRLETRGRVHVHRHSVTFDVSKPEDDDYLTSKDRMGYGLYTMTLRMKPNQSGAIAAGYSYLPNSTTEIDVEEQGSRPGEVEFTNWVNPQTGTMHRAQFSTQYEYHTFSYLWAPGRIAYFVDGVQVCVSTTNVPTEPANFVFEFYATDDATWGGAWVKQKRRMTVVDFSFTPQ